MHRFIIKQYIAMSYESEPFSFLVCFVSILCAWLTVKHLCILVKLTLKTVVASDWHIMLLIHSQDDHHGNSGGFNECNLEPTIFADRKSENL